MANKDAAFGLKPVRMMGGAPYSGGQSRYRIASDYETASIFQGDLVKQVTGGRFERAAAVALSPLSGYLTVVSTQTPPSGEQVLATTTPVQSTASDIIAFVIDDPMTVFDVQADAAFPVADLFGNFDIVDQAPLAITASGRSMWNLM